MKNGSAVKINDGEMEISKLSIDLTGRGLYIRDINNVIPLGEFKLQKKNPANAKCSVLCLTIHICLPL